jgi:hypothetical protein
MHMNAPCTKCSIENAYECKQMHQYQNASYMNAYKCNNMQYHAEGDECIWMKCNENVKNASKCMNMHLNAYGKKQHHFREKTTRIPTQMINRPQTMTWLTMGAWQLCGTISSLYQNMGLPPQGSQSRPPSGRLRRVPASHPPCFHAHNDLLHASGPSSRPGPPSDQLTFPPAPLPP